MNGSGERLVRADYTDETITVYQAYSPQIADAAVRAGRFVPPFSRERMTWIKPSFGWMMQRCGWAHKSGQERVLAISMHRDGFEWALEHSCLSHFEAGTHASYEEWEAARACSPVRVQWDPDRSLAGERLSRRAIQIGLGGAAAHRYADEWVSAIADITGLVHQVESLVRAGRIAEAQQLPAERVYPLAPDLAARICAGPCTESAAGGGVQERGARP